MKPPRFCVIVTKDGAQRFGIHSDEVMRQRALGVEAWDLGDGFACNIIVDTPRKISLLQRIRMHFQRTDFKREFTL